MNKIIKQILGFFFQGLLYVTPIFIPIYIIYSVFESIDLIFKDWIEFYFPGLGVLFVFVIIALIGFLGNIFITQPIKNYFYKWLNRMPLVKVIYNSVKDLLAAFVGKEKKFTKPVLVKVNTISELEKLGFITQEDLNSFGINDDRVTVYFPHSYAFSGEMFVVPKSLITPLDKKSPEVMKFIVSAGVSKS